jgi:hypothetical protein
MVDVQAVSWVFGSIGIALTVGRYAIRWKVTHKFHADDIAHLFATLLMVAALACYHKLIPSIYDFYAFAEGSAPEDDGRFNWMEAMSAVFHILFYTSLWCVKLAFLLFYRTLFKISKSFNITWWVILGYNFVTFWMAIAGSLLQCDGQPSQLGNWRKYSSYPYILSILHRSEICESPVSTPIVRQVYIFTFVAVITSDLATMALPLAMLRGLNMRWLQKCSIGAIFSLSFISIAFETLRVAKSFIGGDTLNVLWINLEMTFAVIVSALPTYYSLFNWRKDKRTSRRYGSSNADLKYGAAFDAEVNRFSRRNVPSYTISSEVSDTEKRIQEDCIMQTHEVRVDVNGCE